MLTLAGPLLAFSGAALFTGSVIHPHNLAVPQTEHAVRRWGWLTVLRVAYYAWSAGGGARRVDRAGRGGGPHGAERAVVPTHSAAVLYGYRSEVVVVAVRWGWILAPLGLVAAALVR